MFGQKGLVANVQDGTEAAASQLGELVNAEHLDIGLGPALRFEPMFKLNHLDVLEADAGVDGAFDNGFGDVHATADSRVVGWGHAVMGGQFVDLDLTELADVADAFALEGAEVGCDAA